MDHHHHHHHHLKDESIYHSLHQMQSLNPPPFADFPHTLPLPPPDPRVHSTRPQPKPSVDAEVKDCAAARKIQKADREKLRRDRLNEQFLDLGSAIDPERPKNDKATILTDTIQLLRDLTSQVDKLKAEYAALTDESRELTQEKNDLREEKASLKSDIENLNSQYQQRLRATYPWGAIDHSMVMAPASYPYPMPVPMPSTPIPMHPSMQPYHFFGNQNPAVMHNPCPTFVPYMTSNGLVDQQSAEHASSPAQPASRSHVLGRQDSKNISSGENKRDKSENSDDATTDLELKTPGSTADQDLSSGERKSKRSLRKGNNATGGSSCSRCSSSRSVEDSSSNSVVGSTKADDLDQSKD